MYPTASLSQPRCLARFFLKDGTVIAEDQYSSLIKYTDLRDVVGADLNDGYDSFLSKDETIDKHLDPILKMCPPNELWQSHVITWRGALTQIMCFPYSSRNDEKIILNCMFKNGILYMEHDKESRLKRPFDPKLTYLGHRFETVCLRNCKTREKDLITSNQLEWCHIYSASLNGMKLIFGAEVDGLDEQESGLVELKTTKEILTNRDDMYFMNKKLLRSWAQSFLVNVPTIIYGFRDAKGVVKKVKRFSTSNIPRMIDKRTGWDPHHMLSFLYKVLNDMKERCSNRPESVFQVVLDPNGRVQQILETEKPSFV